MCTFQEKLFNDKIYAFKYGPVIESVYEKYKGNRDEIDESDIKDAYNAMSIRSRLLFAADGTKKLEIIEKTLDKYGDMSASELVELTHKKKSPWSRTPKGRFVEISDNTILKFYANEIA